MKQLKHIIIKPFLVAILILFSLNANSQVDSLRLALDNVFAHVDKSQIPADFWKNTEHSLPTLKPTMALLPIVIM